MSESNSEILRFIPQRPPFVMIDTLENASEKTMESSFEIKAGHLLVSNGSFQESGLVENMAQTAALFAGYAASKAGMPAPIGYIGALKNLQIHALSQPGEKIRTRIELISEVMDIQRVKASVHADSGGVLAGCELRIFLKPEE